VLTDIAPLQTDIASLLTDIAALQTDIAALLTDIVALQADFAALLTDIVAKSVNKMSRSGRKMARFTGRFRLLRLPGQHFRRNRSAEADAGPASAASASSAPFCAPLLSFLPRPSRR
jgi:hypothetical protein